MALEMDFYISADLGGVSGVPLFAAEKRCLGCRGEAPAKINIPYLQGK